MSPLGEIERKKRRDSSHCIEIKRDMWVSSPCKKKGDEDEGPPRHVEIESHEEQPLIMSKKKKDPHYRGETDKRRENSSY